MFPLNDFNFVACALATFSAAVGYNVSRRRGRTPSGRAEDKKSRLPFLKGLRRNSTASARSSSLSTSTSQSQTESTISAAEATQSDCGMPARVDADESLSDEVEDGSLKRKRSPSPQAALSDTPPSKRRRTPPPEASASEKPEYDEFAVKVEGRTPPLPSEAAGEVSAAPQPAQAPASEAVALMQTAAVGRLQPNEHAFGSEAQSEPSPGSSQPVAASISAETVGETSSAAVAAPTTPPPAPKDIHVAPALTQPIRPSSPSAPVSIWHPTSAIVAAKPSSAFHAFSGQSSTFASSSPSLFASYQKLPVWSANAAVSSALGETPALGAFASSDPNPLAAPEPSTSAQKVATVTGEEDEDVSSELKGAKVFIKRGERDFCEGILGNVKLLKHKKTGAERILFRREPIWKVTMSVRLRPAVWCSFDEAQGALRVTLKERMEDTQQEQLVIYALRRGKASRTEFADFARAVVESSRAQEQAPA
ncbi:hypothetical protein L226DRAFT_108852 [Lentinus tigrinus ALCF2SS1-7]|uniref:RanBD1 domain-containing protein n=1 Tax=Lentinus tigrinus ALCF2SS1-6 TaxID=1328759 RepID=A0A5C2S6V7_9APHY|nr:hypothetical protein L227DRAFT_576592 [Lentinus tigrinus ALCF2SS1-6]RPD73369.1 hypothetical protein L226DRAFT_108852 [Lentinus tigrinus ALCF2SS1-7]